METVLLNLKLPRDLRDDFKVAAKLRGGSMSTLIHQFVVRVIREEKEKNPAAFADFVPEEKAIVMSPNNQQALEILAESFDGEIDLETLRIAVAATKQVKEAQERANESTIPRIEPGKRKTG